jgi:hypothetical protein
MAPTPKAPGARRRRNAEQSKWRTLPRAGRAGRAPALPVKRPAWLKRTREWWATIWASPMATAWEDADVDGLVRLAELKDAVRSRSRRPRLRVAGDAAARGSVRLEPEVAPAMLWMIELEDEPRSRRAARRELARRCTRLRAVPICAVPRVPDARLPGRRSHRGDCAIPDGEHAGEPFLLTDEHAAVPALALPRRPRVGPASRGRLRLLPRRPARPAAEVGQGPVRRGDHLRRSAPRGPSSSTAGTPTASRSAGRGRRPGSRSPRSARTRPTTSGARCSR